MLTWPRTVAASPRCAVEPLESRTLLAVVPSGFLDATYASGISSPTSMAFAPDGRLFVTQQGGALRVITRNSSGGGQLQSTPFLTVSTDPVGERGLLGVAFDPDFEDNGHVYIYYTVRSSPRYNRVSRFTAVDADPDPSVYRPGNTAASGSERVLMNLDPLSSATNHNGGALHFGADGKLYVAVGDNANSSHSQTLANRHGKMLRINADGTVPANNPFYNTAAGANRSIWALGLRNPFTFAVHPASGYIAINDVGQSSWEEINPGLAGANYGWPQTEGRFSSTTYPNYTNPIWAYSHGSGGDQGRSIAGGVYYAPQTAEFPTGYLTDYFYADYVNGWIRYLEYEGGFAPYAPRLVSRPFATGLRGNVDLDVGPDGALYYLERGNGSTPRVGRITYAQNIAPVITSNPRSVNVPEGQPATFSVSVYGAAPLAYQWQRNGVDIPGANDASYTTPAVTEADTGTRYRAVVTNPYGTATSTEATLFVTADDAPTPTITSPAYGARYAAGDTITYAGSATDAEDGPLPASGLTWRVDFHHADHVHPFIPETTGVTGGSFEVPRLGETDANVFYRVVLTARDSFGQETTVFRDVLPRTASLTLQTDPRGGILNLDGQPKQSTHIFTGVVGMTRTLEAPATRQINGVDYEFVSWSDGGARVHDITTPASSTTYTAFYRPAPPRVVGRHVFYNNSRHDGRNPAANAADDLAVAPDKRALLPGERAGFANLTGYWRGINGVMIDVDNLPATASLSAANFSFLTGAGDGTWDAGPAPSSVSKRTGAGVDGSDRITVTFADGRIVDKWLQVVFTPDPRVGVAPTNQDVFYFGNLRGETGDVTNPAAGRVAVTSADIFRTRRSVFTRRAGLDNPYDHNRDGRVTSFDLYVVMRNRLQDVDLFTAPPPPTAASLDPEDHEDLLA